MAKRGRTRKFNGNTYRQKSIFYSNSKTRKKAEAKAKQDARGYRIRGHNARVITTKVKDPRYPKRVYRQHEIFATVGRPRRSR